MSNIIERFHELEVEQTQRRKEQEEREKRELEEAVNERTVVVNRELVDRVRPLVSILREARIEEILKEIQRVKKDLDFNIKLEARFSTVRDPYGPENRSFDNTSDIFSSEMIFPLPYRGLREPETLLEAKSLKLEKDMSLEIEATWGYWRNSDDYGYSYIYIKPEYLENERILKITDGRGDNTLNKEQLSSKQTVEDAIILAVLNPRVFFHYKSPDMGL